MMLNGKVLLQKMYRQHRKIGVQVIEEARKSIKCVFFVVKKLKNSKCTLEIAVRHWNKTSSSVFFNCVRFCLKSVSPN